MTSVKTYIVLLLGAVVLSAVTTVSCDKSSIITERALDAYAQTYLKTYKNLLEYNVYPDHWKYFEFYERYPYHVIATISTTHGIALQFMPSSAEHFEVRTVSERIEQAIFQDEELGMDTPMVKIGVPKTTLRGFHATTGSGYFVEVSEHGSVLIDKVEVDNIDYDYPILIKGSNRKEDWTKEIAASDALNYFTGDILYYLKLDIIDVFLISEEFRQFLAYPELEKIAQRIIDRQNKGEYDKQYGYQKFQNDLAALYGAAEGYGVSKEFSEGLYNFLKEQKEQQEKPSFWERYLYPFVVGIAVVIITSIVTKFILVPFVQRKYS